MSSEKSLYQNQIQQPAAMASLGQGSVGILQGNARRYSKSGRWPASYNTRPPTKAALLQFLRTVVW
jgi:hypothetical protein